MSQHSPAPNPGSTKRPNFLLIVILSAVAILVILVASVLVVRSRGSRMAPHGPNPTPNSLSVPLRGEVAPLRYC